MFVTFLGVLIVLLSVWKPLRNRMQNLHDIKKSPKLYIGQTGPIEVIYVSWRLPTIFNKQKIFIFVVSLIILVNERPKILRENEVTYENGQKNVCFLVEG